MVNTTVDNKQLVLIWGFVVYIEIRTVQLVGLPLSFLVLSVKCLGFGGTGGFLTKGCLVTNAFFIASLSSSLIPAIVSWEVSG